MTFAIRQNQREKKVNRALVKRKQRSNRFLKDGINLLHDISLIFFSFTASNVLTVHNTHTHILNALLIKTLSQHLLSTYYIAGCLLGTVEDL